jgi:hypothetical protein
MAPNPKTYPTNASITGTPTYSNPTSGYVLSTKVCMVGTTNMPKDGATYVSGAKYNTNGSITFSVGSTANVVCTHTFEPTLTVTKNGNGAGTVTGAPVGINCGSTCSDTYPQNTLVTLTATPAASSTFTGWSGAGATNASGQRVVTMSQSYSVTATFTLKTYHLMPTADTGCHILPSNPVAVDHGMSYSSFTATSDPGYTVLGFSIDNGSTTPGTSYTFNNVTADHTIKAKCSLNTVDVIQISPAADTAFPFDATGTPLVVRPVSSAHDPVTIDIQITAVQNPGVLIKEFTWGAYIDTTTGNPNPNYQVQLDFAGAGLQKNVEYWWTAIGTDGYGNYSPARARKFIINPLPKVSCTAQPGEGVAPLSVHFTYTVSNPGAGTEVTTNSGNPGVSDITKGLTGDFYYTYPDPSSETGFTATFRYPGAENGGCTVTVKVNEPGNGGGGEVAP